MLYRIFMHFIRANQTNTADVHHFLSITFRGHALVMYANELENFHLDTAVEFHWTLFCQPMTSQ